MDADEDSTTIGGTLTATDIDSAGGSLSYALKNPAAHGTVTINADGTWTYTPATNYHGTDTFTYTVTDGALVSTPVTVTVHLAPVNDAPTGADSTVAGIEDSTRIGGQLTGSDVDNAAGDLSYTLDTDAVHGTVAVNPDGTWTYTPATDYTGTDSFTYTIDDGQSISAPVTVTLILPGVNDRPVGTAGLTRTGNEDTVITGTVTGTDTDTPAGNLTYALSAQAGHGTVIVNSDGTWTYTPAPDYHGTDTFTFTVYDQKLYSAPVAVTIHVTAVNDAPTGTDTAVSIVEDGGTTGGTLVGTDVDSTALSYALSGAAGRGTAAVGADGTWTYTPATNYSGTDSFTYTITDGTGSSAPITVTVTVTPANDAPTGTDTAVTADEDSTTIGGTLVGVDIDGDVLTYLVGTPAAHGTVTLNSNGTWTYTPTADFNGTDSFTYTVSDGALTSNPVTVTVTIAPVNDAPTADDSEASGSEGTPFGGTLVAADIDSDTGDLRYKLGEQAANGTVTVNADGTWTYTPDPGFHGDDFFTYTVDDGSADSAPVTVVLHVAAVNGAPVGQAGSATGDEDTVISGTLTGTDPDGDTTLTYSLNTQATHGTVTVNSDGTWTYTPATNYHGPDTFTYTVFDGALRSDPATVIIAVIAVNDVPTGSDTGIDVTEDVTAGGTFTGADVDTGASLSYTLQNQAVHGTVTVNSDGTWTYTPATNYHGIDTFTYTITDGQAISTPVTVTVTVTAVNDAPTGTTGLSGSGSEDTTLTGTLTGADIDGDSVTFGLGTQAGHGTVTVNPEGTWTYTPTANYHGTDTFTYTVTDGTLTSTPVTVTLTVAAVNDAPVGTDSAVAADEDSTTIGGTLAGTDFDSAGGSLSYTLTNQAGHGTAAINADGTWTYTPAANYHGSDTFTYTIDDGSLTSAPVTVTITIAAVNDAPTGTTGLTGSGNEDTTLTGTLTGTDIDGDTTTYALSAQAGHGTVTVNPDGTWTYTPTANYHGTDTFTYTVTDGTLTSTPVTVTLTVTAVNDAPTGTTGLTGSGTEDTTLTGTLTGTDIDGDTTTYALSAQAGHGTVTINPDGTWTYTPTANYHGTDTFTYTVTDGTLTGTVTINPDGTWTYTPTANYHGTDTFTYTVTDGTLTSTPVTVTLTVTAVNDAPTGTTGLTGSGNEDTTLTGTLTGTDIDGDTTTYALSAQAGHGTVTINPDGTWTYTPTANYHGTDTFTYTVTDGTLTGTVTINPDGTWTYTPTANYHGTDTFTYTVTDGTLTSTPVTVTLTVTAVNDLPTGTDSVVDADEDATTIGGTLTGSDIEATDPSRLSYVLDTDVAHGTVEVNEDGTWTYTPNADYTGTDSFTYIVVDADGAFSEPVTVTINLNPVNDAPVGTAGLTGTGTEDNLIAGTLTGTDTDGDALDYALGAQATHGTVTVNSNGTWTYTPAANFSGTDTFTYTVTDGTATSAPVTVTLTVTAVNDAPSGTAGLTGSGAEDNAITGTLTGTDVDGDTLTYALSGQATHGTVTVDSNGTWTYTPATNYHGTDTFTYTVSDGRGEVSTPVTVNLTIAAVNDAPVAQGDSFSTAEDTALNTGNLLSNDTDVDGNTVVVLSNTQPTHGSVTVNSDGSFSYVPDPDYNGTDGFSYTISDQNGLTSTASVTIAVTAVNDRPVGIADSFTTDEDTPYTGTVLGNDTDADGNSLTAIVVVGPQHGSLQWNSNGTFTYTPYLNYNGTDTFTYQASDGPLTSTATLVTMTVTAVNDVPTAGGSVTGGSGAEDSTIAGTVSFGDTDTADATAPDSTTLSVTTQAQHGSVTLNQNGSYTYTPTGNYAGTDTFTYTVTDSHGATATATVNLTVTPVNDAPAAAGDSFGTVQQSAVKSNPTQIIGNVLTNDTDVDAGDTRTVTGYTQPVASNGSTGTIGTVAVAANGNVIYTPPANGYHNYDGVVTFGYTITDSSGATSTATASFSLNDDIAPTAVDVQTVNTGSTGLLNAGDSITYTFSEPIDPSTLIAGWDGSGSRMVTVRVNDGAVVSLLGLEVLGTNDSLQIYDSSNSTQLASLGTASLGTGSYALTTLGLGGLLGTYYHFDGSTMTMSGDRTSVTITLGTYTSDSVAGLGAPVRTTNLANNTLQWFSSTAAKDIAGTGGSGNTVTETGTADRDF
nr:Ig-like domain-containing protein [Mycolicibacterium bacteremicum]